MKLLNGIVDLLLFCFALFLVLLAVAPACLAAVLLFSAAVLSGVTDERSAR